MVERLKRKFGVEVTTAPAKIAYRETIRGSAKATRPPREADRRPRPVRRVQHRDRSRSLTATGSSTRTRSSVGAIPHQFIPSIEKGIVKTMSEGVISGNPMVDLKVTLVDGKFHPVDSSDMAFQIAGSMALKDAVETGRRRSARADRRSRSDRARGLHRRHHGRPQLQARQDRGHGAGRVGASSVSEPRCHRPRSRATSSTCGR